MAAAGCGSATAAAVGGQGGTATARGRFPGRPWSSRSRLRSEKRWQLGRSGAEADDVTNGGPRPTNLVLSLNEDQSHLRLLGIEANHKSLGQAGYSSSGSEEVRSQTEPGVSIFISSSDILFHSLSPEAEPAKDSRKSSKGKNTTERQSTKSGASSTAPRITIKLVAKKKVKKVKEPHKKSVKKLKIKAFEDQPKAKEIQGDQISSAHVKLKTEPHDHQHSTEDKGEEAVPARRRGRSASKSTEPGWPANVKVEVDDQKSKEKKSAGQPDIAQESGTMEITTNAKKSKQKEMTTEQGSDMNQVGIRRSRRVTNPPSKSVPDCATQPENQSTNEVSPAESVLEVSRIEEAKPLTRNSRRLQFIGSKRPKAQSKTISKLVGIGLDKAILKQEETDSLVDEAQADVLDAQPGRSKFVKNIKHFIMPVVSARSSRVIKTPQRFMDDAGMSVLPRRNSPKKGLQLGMQIRQGKRRDDGRAISPVLPVEDEDILSEAQLDVAHKKRKNPKFNKQTSHLKIYERLKKLPPGLPRIRKTTETDTGKSKLKIEDLDTPGVVRKVSVCVRTMNSKFLAFKSDRKLTGNCHVLLQPTGKLQEEQAFSAGVEGDGPASVEKGASQRMRLTGANKRMFNLLKKAKVQLIKIDQQKQLKSSGLLSGSSGTRSRDVTSKRQRRKPKAPAGGPRIKHVCRAAAVVLGQPRALVPDDIPRLSALPLHERTGISPSVITKASAFVKRKGLGPFGYRSRRCGVCKGCNHEDDCGKCMNCLDKPKFGGPNTKRQCLGVDLQAKILVTRCFSTCFFFFFLQEDCTLENVWNMGGLSILTSVPVMPPCVCLLCASKGQHEMLYCQVCCEPFHQFCLEPAERPSEENKENWCCRRCKFCHVCGRKNKLSKPLLECERCQNCYHAACLGPNYPKYNKKRKAWVCMTCIRCKSCGVTPGKSWDTDWNHDKGLCPDCSHLFDQGNYCPICFKCYEDNDYDSQMMQCGTCNHWVHAKCEDLTDDLYEILSSLPESVVYSCRPCSLTQPSAWRELLYIELRAGVEKVLACLLSSTLTQHLVTCSQVRHSHLTVWDGVKLFLQKTFHEDVVQVVRKRLEQEENLPEEERPTALARSYYLKEAGRLLYLGQNEWAHVNCCLWSAEVFEEDNGSLLHVHSAVTRGRLMRCERCNQTGATVGCCLTSCQSNYHFMCARSRHCVFQDDKKVYCYKHRHLISGKMISGQGFEVNRRVYVDFEGISLRRKFLTGLEPESISVMIGSLQIDKLGVLTELSVGKGKLFPVGFQCSRWYWSTVNPLRRCKYTCTVREVRPVVPEKPVEEMPDQGDNHTIAHSPSQVTDTAESQTPTEVTLSHPGPIHKPDHAARPKIPSYPQTRRPAGGMSRPLPSPGATQSKPHHILTISDLEETRRPRRHSPHSQTAGLRSHMPPPPLGTLSGPITLRAGKSSLPTSPLFPLGATDNLLTSPSPRPVGGRSASSVRCPGSTMTHSTSAPFPHAAWQDSVGSFPSSNLSFSSAIQHSPRPRLSFDLSQSDSVEVPHNFLASPEPEDISTANGTSPLRDSVQQKDQEFPYGSFHKDPDMALGSELKTELEIEETLLNEGVAMNCGGQIVVEGDDQEEFWGRAREVHKRKALVASLPRSSARDDMGNTSSDDDMEHYFDFSRTIVSCGSRDHSKSPSSPSSRPITQLDGVDDGTESDASITTSDDTQKGEGSSQVPIPAKNLNHKLLKPETASNKDSVEQGPVPKALCTDKLTESATVAAASQTSMDTNTAEPSLADSADSSQGSLLDLLQPSCLMSTDLHNHSQVLVDPLQMNPSLPGFSQPPLTSITLQQVTSSQDPTNLPPMDSLCTKLTTLSPVGDMSQTPVNVTPQNDPDPMLSATSSTCHPVATFGAVSVPMYTTQTQPLASTAITITTSVPVMLNGYSSSSLQKEASSGHTISINFATPRPALEPQQPVVGGPNVDPTPHVLLVNRLGQIFVKNPESNTFQLPTPNSPSYNCVTQIASLLQSNALSATLAAPTASRRSKSAKALGPSTPRTESPPMTPAESAQAIITQAMASNYTPKWGGFRTLSPSSLVLPPGLLIEPEPPKSPPLQLPNPAPRPRTHVRMKRVSSLSDRIVTKKSKVDFLEPEPPSDDDEHCRPHCPSITRASGVRIKTPTVKAVLNLDKLNEEHLSDSDMGHSTLTDWKKYSDDEPLPSDEDVEFPGNREQPHLLFQITSDDGFSVEADSIEVAWRAVIDGVQEARAIARLRQLTFLGMTGARMLGLVHDAVVFLVEQLQGARRCQGHTFRFFKQFTQEEDLPVNPSGCARSELYLRSSTFDIFNFLASQHRQLPDIGPYDDEEDEVLLKSTRRATSLELPMAMRFRHLERTSKEAVGVYRSAIHGRGLFCKRNIEAGEMVIEYAGIVIRSVLTDKREKYYDGKGIGCYMFRIDDFDVVDATMHGNAARFINHSCEPNCYSRVINVEGQKHIVIFALRKIYRGEELTYDYKFPIEDASNKLSCNCGARRCRRFLN
uniref:[histone H3]-lysine(4) N-methyltransferase n=1 Tax=Myripristis murdjan TaxID=586833 RepID=A0A667ZQF1_9TELE